MKITRITEENWIDVVGHIWMPNTVAAMRYDLRQYDVENIGEPTRENVDAWLARNAGDFQSVDDFHAVVGETDLPWTSEDSEMTFADCMFPIED